MTALDGYFRERGVAIFNIAPGVATPARFTSAAEEHLATRRACGLFDFSFMASVEIRGRQSLAFLHRLQTRNLARLAPGRIAYTLMLREDGTVLNDTTVWCFGADHYALFTGHRDDLAHVHEVARGFEVTLTHRAGDHAVIAVQGVRAWPVLAQYIDGAPADVPYFGFWSASFQGQPCWIARIGYSGETGYEFIVNAAQASALWDALREAGTPMGLAECGFDAVNSLRVEAGHVLFNAELATAVTPRALGLLRLVDIYAYDFIGKSGLSLPSKTTPEIRLVGLIHLHHAKLSDATEAQTLIGDDPMSGVRITSACYSPLFQCVLALGFVRAQDAAPGTRMRLVQGASVTVARLPFYDPAKHLARRTR